MSSVSLDNWVEHLVVLRESGTSILESLHFIKYTIEPEISDNVKRMNELGVYYKNSTITAESRPKAAMPRPKVIADATFHALVKLSSKRFPEFPDFSKVLIDFC